MYTYIYIYVKMSANIFPTVCITNTNNTASCSCVPPAVPSCGQGFDGWAICESTASNERGKQNTPALVPLAGHPPVWQGTVLAPHAKHIKTCRELRPFTLWWTNIAMERSTIFNGKIHYKWPFLIAMLVHQRVSPLNRGDLTAHQGAMQPRWLADSRGQQEDLEGTDPLPQVRRLQMEAVHRPGAVQGPTGGPHHLQAGPAESPHITCRYRADISANIYIHTHRYIYIYIYMCVCVWNFIELNSHNMMIYLSSWYHLFHIFKLINVTESMLN